MKQIYFIIFKYLLRFNQAHTNTTVQNLRYTDMTNNNNNLTDVDMIDFDNYNNRNLTNEEIDYLNDLNLTNKSINYFNNLNLTEEDINDYNDLYLRDKDIDMKQFLVQRNPPPIHFAYECHPVGLMSTQDTIDLPQLQTSTETDVKISPPLPIHRNYIILPEGPLHTAPSFQNRPRAVVAPTPVRNPTAVIQQQVQRQYIELLEVELRTNLYDGDITENDIINFINNQFNTGRINNEEAQTLARNFNLIN